MRLDGSRARRLLLGRFLPRGGSSSCESESLGCAPASQWCRMAENTSANGSQSSSERSSEALGSSVSELMPLVYDELRRLAACFFRDGRSGGTLQPTALVHEAYLRLADRPSVRPKSRTHLIHLAARAMRNVLADFARARNASKRQGDRTRVTLSDLPDPARGDCIVADHIDLVDAIDRLSRLNPRHAEIVVLRFFGGLTVHEVAEELGVSFRTVEDDWRLARAWLVYALESGRDER